MIRKLEDVIAGFSDYDHHARIAEALRYFSEHPEQQGEEFGDSMTRTFGVPTLIRIIKEGHHDQLPVEVLVDELIDFSSVFFAQNTTRKGNQMLIRFPDQERAAQIGDDARGVDVMAELMAMFANQFTSYITKVFGDG